MAVVAVLGFDLPTEAQTYSGAQIAGFLALALLATLVFLIAPWIAAVWFLRRDHRRAKHSH